MTRTSQTCRQRILAIIALLAYLAGAIGLPVPALTPAVVEEAEPTPATPPLHRCGCPVGEQANGTCCCSQSGGGCCGGQAPAAEPDEQQIVQWSAGLWSMGCRGGE